MEGKVIQILKIFYVEKVEMLLDKFQILSADVLHGFCGFSLFALTPIVIWVVVNLCSIFVNLFSVYIDKYIVHLIYAI